MGSWKKVVVEHQEVDALQNDLGKVRDFTGARPWRFHCPFPLVDAIFHFAPLGMFGMFASEADNFW